MDIKVVSPLAVYDKYWDSDTLSYKRTAAVPATEQKRLPRQIAAIIEHVEKTFSDKADSKWLKQAIEDVLYPARAFERNHPNLLRRIHEYLVKFDGADRTKEHIIRTKILPYFGKLKISEISTKEVIAWQNEMLAYRDEKKKPYSQTYLKTLHNQLSAIFNHAVRYYELRSNPAAKAGNMGSEEHKGNAVLDERRIQEILI